MADFRNRKCGLMNSRDFEFVFNIYILFQDFEHGDGIGIVFAESEVVDTNFDDFV